MEPIILVGGGGHCRSCIDVIESENKYKIIGIIDVESKLGENIFGYNLIGTDEDLSRLSGEFSNFLITVGQIKSPERRMKLYTRIKDLGGKFPVIQSPFARVSPHATIAEGTIIMHHALVNAGATIGSNCIINSKALVEHDAIIGNHCHISTGAIINGGVIVGSGSFIGSGAVTKQNCSIAENSFIKAHTLVK